MQNIVSNDSIQSNDARKRRNRLMEIDSISCICFFFSLSLSLKHIQFYLITSILCLLIKKLNNYIQELATEYAYIYIVYLCCLYRCILLHFALKNQSNYFKHLPFTANSNFSFVIRPFH